MEHIVSDQKEYLMLINSDKLKPGDHIVWDEIIIAK